MAVQVDKLLTLKAFYLARKIITRPQSKADALKMIDVAIEALTEREGDGRETSTPVLCFIEMRIT
jgi:hypothetical protein